MKDVQYNQKPESNRVGRDRKILLLPTSPQNGGLRSKQNHRKLEIKSKNKKKNKRESYVQRREFPVCSVKWRIRETETYKSEIDVFVKANLSAFCFVRSKSINRLGVTSTRPTQHVMFFEF